MTAIQSLELTKVDYDNIENALQQLTLDEKAQLISGSDWMHTVLIKDQHRNLNIPKIRMNDGPNGTRGIHFYKRTPTAGFPNGTSLGSTFNKDLLFEAGKLMAEEAKHKGASVILGPTVNIQRGPNGGRGFESFSEDPTVSGLAAAEIIKGIQSQNIIATIKHYVCNDLEDERRTINAIVTERALREVYLKPFQLALKYSNPNALMTSYNRVNGTHASQSKHLLEDILRKEWGYDGTVMSDWFGTYNLVESIANGLDLEMPGLPKIRTASAVNDAVVTKEVKEVDLDQRVENVLKLIARAKHAKIPEDFSEDTDNNTPETRAFLRKLAAEGIVLLKNEDNVLPLNDSDSIAVIGPNAKAASLCGGGSAWVNPYYTTTAYDSILERAKKEPSYALGAYSHKYLPSILRNLYNPETGENGYSLKFYNQLKDAKQLNDNFFHQDNLTETTVNFADFQYATQDEFYAVLDGVFVPEESAVYDFGLIVNGTGQIFIDDELVVDNKTQQKQGEAFYGLGTVEVRGHKQLDKGKEYKFRIEFGSLVTSLLNQGPAKVGRRGYGALIFGGAKQINEKEEIEYAVEVASKVDKAVVVVGLSHEWESEGDDRSDLQYPGRINELVSAVAKANPNTIVVNQSGTPLEFPWANEVQGIVQSWFNGIEQGNALTDVLFGDVNPSGKLSLTFPRKFEDNPAYLNFTSDFGDVVYGEDIFVGYKYYEKLNREVLFPFGFGLSYTKFEFSELGVNADLQRWIAEVLVNVKNIGGRDGSEVVQIYIRNSTDLGTRKAIKELRDFAKVFVKAGETKKVKLEFDLREALSHWDNNKTKWSVEKGKYYIQVGNSSDNILLEEPVVVENPVAWLGL